ncbi:hypothetical protein D3C84_481260 [compost metagenome]
MQGHGIDVVVLAVLRFQAHGFGEGLERPRQVALAHQHQAIGVVQQARLRVFLQPLVEQGATFFPTEIAIQPLHQGDQRREEIRVPLQGGPQMRLHHGRAAIGLVEHGQVEVGLGTLLQAELHGLVFVDGLVPALLVVAEAGGAHAQQLIGGGNAHSAQRIAQQGRQQVAALFRWHQGGHGLDGRLAHLRRGIDQVLGRGLEGALAGVGGQLGQQGGAADGRQVLGLQLLEQRPRGPGLAIADQPEALVIARCAGLGFAIPEAELLGDLVPRLVGVAAEAGVWNAQAQGARRVGQGEAVVMAIVVDHEELARHVAIHTLGAGLALGVMMVFGGVIVLGLQPLAIDPFDTWLAGGVVALQADAVARGLERRAVGIVAIAAAHALGEHLALGEGAVLEHLILDLAVQLVEFSGQGAGQVVVHQPPVAVVAVVQGRAAGMATGAGFDFGERVGLGQVEGEAGVGRVAPFRRPLQVLRCRAVAGLAADAEAVPVAGETVLGRVVIAFETGGVALHAHEVGVLLRAAPVQRVLEVHALSRIEVEPGAFLHVPGHPEGLQSAAGGFDQVLLQGRDAEGIGHPEISCLAVSARGVDPEAAVLAEETSGFLVVLEAGVVEVAEHAGFARFLHGQLMVTALPVLGLLGMAAGALAFVHHPGRLGDGLGRWWLRARQPGRAALEVQPDAEAGQQQEAGQDRVDGAMGRGGLLGDLLVVLRHADIRCAGERVSGWRAGSVNVPEAVKAGVGVRPAPP